MAGRSSPEATQAGSNFNGVTREEVLAECARLAEEDPDRETHRFVPREGADGIWTVAKVGLPPVPIEPLGQESRADEKPPTPDDPRDSLTRNLGPWVPGGF